MTTRVTGRVVTPEGVVEGHVELDGDRIVAVEGTPASGTPAGSAPADRGEAARDGAMPWIVPGFVDIHSHGGGGHTFTTGDPESARQAAAFHLRHGATSQVASLVSSPYELMYKATAALAPLVNEGVLAGVHYEGPYLAERRCGAQNPEFLRDASLDELRTLIALGEGTLRMVTLAPERPGAPEAISLLVRAGVVAAVGHTDATYEQTMAAIRAGATVATHLFNGMPQPHHREPGPALALLGAPGVTCELIADGVHLHDGMLAFAASVAGPARIALITDAISATGMPDGEYELGGQPVMVADGVVRLMPDGALAGSTLTMDAALRRTVEAGVPLVDACRMASTTPARTVGLDGEVGALRAGLRADLLVLDEGLRVRKVMRAGRWM